MWVSYEIDDREFARHFTSREEDFGSLLEELHWRNEEDEHLRRWAQRVFRDTNNRENAKRVIDALAKAFEDTDNE